MNAAVKEYDEVRGLRYNSDKLRYDLIPPLANRDFIIGFLEFIEGTYSYSNIYDHWYLHADTSKTYSKKQLLEVYLKRNKL